MGIIVEPAPPPPQKSKTWKLDILRSDDRQGMKLMAQRLRKCRVDTNLEGKKANKIAKSNKSDNEQQPNTKKPPINSNTSKQCTFKYILPIGQINTRKPMRTKKK